MGHRANYALVEDGQQRLYFSRWGAIVVPSVLLGGPEATSVYIRALTPTDHLLNNTWAEGGIVLDIDQKHLLFWGGQYAIDCTTSVRRTFLAVLRTLWPGWTVEWAMGGIVDLARSVGWDVSQVIDTHFDENLASAVLHENEAHIDGRTLRTTQRLENGLTVLSVRRANSGVADYLLSTPQDRVLRIGPRLLDLISRKQGGPLPHENGPVDMDTLLIDETTHTLWLYNSLFSDPRFLEAYMRYWPEWHVRVHADGIVGHVQLSGRDPAPVKASEERAIAALLDELMSESTVDPERLYQALTRDGEQVAVGTAFFSRDDAPLTPEQRREILSQLVHDVLSSKLVTQQEDSA